LQEQAAQLATVVARFRLADMPRRRAAASGMIGNRPPIAAGKQKRQPEGWRFR
jgi:hypothetical protein